MKFTKAWRLMQGKSAFLGLNLMTITRHCVESSRLPTSTRVRHFGLYRMYGVLDRRPFDLSISKPQRERFQLLSPWQLVLNAFGISVLLCCSGQTLYA